MQTQEGLSLSAEDTAFVSAFFKSLIEERAGSVKVVEALGIGQIYQKTVQPIDSHDNNLVIITLEEALFLVRLFTVLLEIRQGVIKIDESYNIGLIFFKCNAYIQRHLNKDATTSSNAVDRLSPISEE
jgi:hypothetical protein